MAGESSPAPARRGRRVRWLSITGTLLVALALAPVVRSALLWQGGEEARTRCLSNERRLATALLLYAQDHDGGLPPIDYRRSDGTWRDWVSISAPYIEPQDITICPSNRATGARHPQRGYPFPHSYALNTRYFGFFHPGPFPLDNLEIAAQTALLVEGGKYRADGPYGVPTYPWAMSGYWDTAWWPNVYASPHRRRMNVAAADGHVSSIRVSHYDPGGHDAVYGRLGGELYNWNGGHPNGDTGGPPRE